MWHETYDTAHMQHIRHHMWHIWCHMSSRHISHVTCQLVHAMQHLCALPRVVSHTSFVSHILCNTPLQRAPMCSTPCRRSRVVSWDPVSYLAYRPTQSLIYVPLHVNIFHENILRIVQYKNLKSCSGVFYSPESDPPHKMMWYWIYYSIWLGLSFRPDSKTTLVWSKWFVPQLYQCRRGISGGPALKYF